MNGPAGKKRVAAGQGTCGGRVTRFCDARASRSSARIVRASPGPYRSHYPDQHKSSDPHNARATAQAASSRLLLGCLAYAPDNISFVASCTWWAFCPVNHHTIIQICSNKNFGDDIEIFHLLHSMLVILQFLCDSILFIGTLFKDSLYYLH